jgi:hypothetical protein
MRQPSRYALMESRGTKVKPRPACPRESRTGGEEPKASGQRAIVTQCEFLHLLVDPDRDFRRTA